MKPSNVAALALGAVTGVVGIAVGTTAEMWFGVGVIGGALGAVFVVRRVADQGETSDDTPAGSGT